jgi:hypothetical protein
VFRFIDQETAMQKSWIAILLLLLTPSAVAEAIQYEIYEMPSTGGEPDLIAKGTRQYTVKDVEVYPYQRDGLSMAEKMRARDVKQA